MAQQPNILWICTDQQRSDTIQAWGNDHIRTPVLNCLAAHGVSFLNTYCQSPICTPSRGSFLSGQYPAATLIHRNGQEGFARDITLVTKRLAQAGYVCGLIGKLHLTAAELGMEVRTDDGYSFMEWSHHPYPQAPEYNDYVTWLQEQGIDPSDLFPKTQQAYSAGIPEEYHQTHWCAVKAMEFIGKQKDEPWLLSINMFDPHPPMDPPETYLQRYDHENIPFPIFCETDIEHQKKFRGLDQQSTFATDPRTVNPVETVSDLPSELAACLPPKHIDSRKLISAYYAQIEFIDYEIGRVIDYLEEIGELGNTVIIFHSDHGEMLGDHGLYFKGARFFESLVKVPLIISNPGTLLENVRSDALVELVDITPTILDLCHIEISKEVQGASLVPILTGERDPQRHKDSVFCEFNDALGPKTISNEHKGTHGIMYYDGHYKISVYDTGNVGELYDIWNDPNEFSDLWDSEDHTAVKSMMLEKLLFRYMGTASKGAERISEY